MQQLQVIDGSVSFRGRNPPASLKLEPGVHGPRGAARRFRGRNPPASLKPLASETAVDVSAVRFRGRNPPASLKL